MLATTVQMEIPDFRGTAARSNNHLKRSLKGKKITQSPVQHFHLSYEPRAILNEQRRKFERLMCYKRGFKLFSYPSGTFLHDYLVWPRFHENRNWPHGVRGL